MCECGANFGDWFLHSEPGEGGFFPTTEEEAHLIIVNELDLSEAVHVDADAIGSISALILKHGTTKGGNEIWTTND